MYDLPRVATHPWHTREHHAPDGGFRNLWPPHRSGSFWKGMTWFLGHVFSAKQNRLPAVRPVEPAALRTAPSSSRLTWIGHSTLLVQSGSLNLLIDPIFSDRASPFTLAGPRREPALPLSVDDLPEVDVVILSHDHYDHLDERTLKRLIARDDPVVLSPLGVADYARGWGSERVLELDWWQYVDHGSIRYHCLPAKHFSGRSMLDRDDTLWAGWYVQGRPDEIDLYYAGDTGYAEHFGSIRDRIGRPDVAVLPIGAYMPAWLMQPIHINPEESLRAFRDLEARHFIPVHWGTFDLADEPLHAPVETLRRLIRQDALAERVHVLEIGETWSIPGDS